MLAFLYKSWRNVITQLIKQHGNALENKQIKFH
jgi:hypothetical protein